MDGTAISNRGLAPTPPNLPRAAPAHICFLNPQGEFYSPISGGAVATITMQTAAALARRGHSATVLTPSNGDELYPIGRVVPVNAPKRHELSTLQRVCSKIRRTFNEWDTAYYDRYLVSYAKAIKSIPAPQAVVVYNDFVSPRYIKSLLPNSRIIVNLQNEQGTTQPRPASALVGVHRFLACSEHIRTWTCEKYNLDPARFAVLNSGVDLSAFHPRPQYDSPSSPLKVLFIGRIDPNKGPDIVADAVIALRQQEVPVELTVAGGLWFYGHGNEMTDPYFRALKSKMDVANANYVGHVTRPDVPALVRAHDVVCVLSRSREPFGLVVLEAMASGCAVLSSNRGGLPDACGFAGVMLDPENLHAVVDQLRLWATNAAKLIQAKRASVARAATASWDRVAEGFEKAVLL